MNIITLKEQQEHYYFSNDENKLALSFIEDGGKLDFAAEDAKPYLQLSRGGDTIKAEISHYVGIDWISEQNLAVQVYPKMNDGFEIDYVSMLNDALKEDENYKHLQGLVTIDFYKPSIPIEQKQDFLSVFLITQYINILHKIVRKGLKKSYYLVEENLKNKVKGHIEVGKNIRQNIVRGHLNDNVCRYQVYDIDSTENRILKKALIFCIKQVGVFKHAFETNVLNKKIQYIKPAFEYVGNEVSVSTIQSFNSNPIYKDYILAIDYAKLILKKYSYNITSIGKKEVRTPPYWIDMAKLFELYVYHHLRKVFIGKNEVVYHPKAHYQEPDYLLNAMAWNEPYVIDAKYKPRYSTQGITMDDARQVSGYARLSSIYNAFHLDEETALPIKCLIIYPNQNNEDYFSFSRDKEPEFDKINGYVRMYKQGIKLPVIESH